MGRASDKAKAGDVQGGESSTESVSLEDENMIDEGEDTPDLYRNSALGMFVMITIL